MTNTEVAKLIEKMKIEGLEIDEPFERDGAIYIPYKWQNYHWQIAQWEIEPGIDDMIECTARYWATFDMQPGRRAGFNGYPVWCAAEDMLNTYAREMFRLCYPAHKMNAEKRSRPLSMDGTDSHKFGEE